MFCDEAPDSGIDIDTMVPTPGRPFLRIFRWVNGLIMGPLLIGDYPA